ncbi:hypothetical protein SARC_15751, partial [Sphaeroforma arctica JP610]
MSKLPTHTTNKPKKSMQNIESQSKSNRPVSDTISNPAASIESGGVSYTKAGDKCHKTSNGTLELCDHEGGGHGHIDTHALQRSEDVKRPQRATAGRVRLNDIPTVREIGDTNTAKLGSIRRDRVTGTADAEGDTHSNSTDELGVKYIQLGAHTNIPGVQDLHQGGTFRVGVGGIQQSDNKDAGVGKGIHQMNSTVTIGAKDVHHSNGAVTGDARPDASSGSSAVGVVDAKTGSQQRHATATGGTEGAQQYIDTHTADTRDIQLSNDIAHSNGTGSVGSGAAGSSGSSVGSASTNATGGLRRKTAASVHSMQNLT